MNGIAFMTNGKVTGIYIAQNRGGPTVSINQVHVIPGMGIEGDRYFNFYQNRKPDSVSGKEITLIESEVIEYLCEIDKINITPSQTRRNIVTRGIRLNDLVGQNFTIGNVRLHGIRLCEPCQYLANRTDQRILPSMVHKGGLRAAIETEGYINVDDRITLTSKEQV